METRDLGHGRGWLRLDAAASLARIDRQIGHPLQITEAGRTWAQQKAHWDHYQRYGSPIALHPDTPSVHQLGAAIDTDERLTAILNDHGWFHTVYRNGKLIEPWHYEYSATRDNHRHEGWPASTGAKPLPTPDEEDDMTLIRIKGKAGARRGGLYAVIGRDAVFLGDDKGSTAGVVTITDEDAIAALQKKLTGLQ